MRGKTLLILTVVVLGVGAFIWLYGRHQPGTDELVEQADKVLPRFGSTEARPPSPSPSRATHGESPRLSTSRLTTAR
jgi:hypothetical protein